MKHSSPYRVLNRLLTILDRSLPSYLTNTSPWTRPGEEQALETTRRIAEDQRQLSDRAAEYTLERYGPIELGHYPIDFFDTHDLSLDFLLKKMVACQRRDIEALTQVVADLNGDRQAAMLAEEALGAARGHLETLEELVAHPVKVAPVVAAPTAPSDRH